MSLSTITSITRGLSVNICSYSPPSGSYSISVPSLCGTYSSFSTVIVGLRISVFTGKGISQILSVFYCDFWNVSDTTKWHIAVSGNSPDINDPRVDVSCQMPTVFGTTSGLGYSVLITGQTGQALTDFLVYLDNNSIENIKLVWSTIYNTGFTQKPADTVGYLDISGNACGPINSPLITSYVTTPSGDREPIQASSLFVNRLDNVVYSSGGINFIPTITYINLQLVIDSFWDYDAGTPLSLSTLQDYCCVNAANLTTPSTILQAECALLGLTGGVSSTACQALYADGYCATGSNFLSSTGCTQYCELPGTNCDSILQSFCATQVLTTDSLVAGSDLANICGCFQPAAIENERCSEIQSIFNTSVPCQNAPCFDPFCTPSTALKPYSTKAGTAGACPNITQCLESIVFNNNGTIPGNVDLSQITACAGYAANTSGTTGTTGTSFFDRTITIGGTIITYSTILITLLVVVLVLVTLL